MLGYTLGQFEAYLDAAAERDGDALRQQLHVAAIAGNATALQAVLKSLGT